MLEKIRRNYECYKARAAVQYFYDGVDKPHQDELDKIWKTFMDCLRLFGEAVSRTLNQAKKEANRRKHEEQMNRNKNKKQKTDPVPFKPKAFPIMGTSLPTTGVEVGLESLTDTDLATLESNLSRNLLEVKSFKRLH
jgi:hypothetical protein